MASFLLIIHSDHYANQSSRSALKFANAAIKNNHQINGIFFYQQGVLHASMSADVPSDELDTRQGFINLKKNHQIELLVCVTAAEKRGTAEHHLAEFTIAGLAEMASISCEVDRIVQFK